MRTSGGRQHGIELVAVLLEGRQRLAVEHAAARQLDPHRIDEAAVDDDFECTCEPVDSPDEPTKPMIWPWRTWLPT